MDFSTLTQDEFNLHNPAYCGFLIYSIVREYGTVDKNGINPALLYLCLPLILTKSLSSQLPRTSKTSLVAWLVENEGHLFNFANKVTSFFEITQNSFDFLYENHLLELTENYDVVAIESGLAQSPVIFNKSEAMKKQLNASKLMGRWLAVSPNAATIYSVLGIRP
ncbi:three component ABC system middle component [uncultured Paraglaciecola sp.]|uniref:three component ABC system middle component n=1 Tax=uncultured Paraglaciecola sp. TaxID=1765024 RepID=UPI00260FD49F|nr:three component ABC system middle component [uncultured Paraglaciecola sp.]